MTLKGKKCINHGVGHSFREKTSHFITFVFVSLLLFQVQYQIALYDNKNIIIIKKVDNKQCVRDNSRDNQQQEMKKEQFNNLFANNLKRRANYYIFIAYKKEIVSISLRFSHFFILLNVISVETHTQVAEILLRWAQGQSTNNPTSQHYIQ